MADPKGFMTTPRELPKRRPVDVRIKDLKINQRSFLQKLKKVMAWVRRGSLK